MKSKDLSTELPNALKRVDGKYTVPVLHLVLSLDMGGLEVVVVNFIKKMNKEQYLPMVCCLDSKGLLAEVLELEGIEVFSFQREPGFDIRLIFKLASAMKERRVKILHTHDWGAHVYGTLAAWIMKVPIVVHTQHGKLSPYTWKRKVFAFLMGRLIDQFVGVSEDISGFAKKSGWVPEGKIRTILNGINMEEHANSLFIADIDKVKIRQELGIPLDATVIMNVARLSEEKDHFTLLKAFSYLKDRFDSLFLVIVGDGPLMGTLKWYASNLEIEKNVTFTGMRRDVPVLLRCADLFVLSSKSEGISISLLEAMAAGLPVIATDVGGNSQLVIHGKTGLLVSPQSPQRLAEAFLELFHNRSLTKQMGESGFSRVNTGFGMDKMIHQYQEVYDNLLKARRLCRV